MPKQFTRSVSAILVGLSLSVTTLYAKESSELPQLVPEVHHAKAAKRLVSTYARNHYVKFSLDDDLSQKIFERYLRNLDYNKNFFLASDIESFANMSKLFDEALMTSNVQIAYDIYAINLQRRHERLDYALSLLNNEFDFTKAGDKFFYDREDAQWAANTAELNEIWRQRVKYDLSNLILADKSVEEAKALLKKRYERSQKRLSQTKSEDVFQAFMNAFSRSIEAHTSYLSPRNAERFQMQMNLSFEGIGASLQVEDDYTVIRAIIPGGPADASGKLKPEDKIVGVAQDKDEMVDVVGWRLDDVVELIKGPKGTTVRLEIIKGSADSKSREVISLVRDKVKLEDRQAQSKVVVPDEGVASGLPIGVIEIPSFYNGLTQHVRKLITELKEQEVAGIIVDLRGNGGGSLNESRTLTGLFIDSGPVVQVRSSNGQIDVERDVDGITLYDGPLTVLVDRFSASASEIFAAAIQDYQRGIVLGEQTFGKGTVQRHKGLGRFYDVQDTQLGSIQYTTSKFYRISGGSTQHRGVIPDILFPSAIDPAEWGESREENALPYDEINRANYVALGNRGNVIDLLAAKHNKRIMQDPEFAYILDDISEYQRKQDDKFISLVLSERKAEDEANKAKRLERANARLQRLGKNPVQALSELDDLPDDLLDIDPFLDEAANITNDYIRLDKVAQRIEQSNNSN
ncbi:carboxy terminal-processing peptidase [Alteromonas sp. LMIT006]|uniref:carboxy terminal-processing peptidase n=1 Tax=Alteromonadaceae TaxID=72275 RepID=UPI0020CA39AA|nr:carboxy terminal-processing peptidase [Alteromonas sp. LMIT006]UTP72125.1 carboxy terminal-processing peptidase [Alteromonas sp. LMIT006]